MMGKKVSVCVGQRFGKLVVTGEPVSVPSAHYRLAVCACDCGKVIPIPAAHLLSGRAKSCGCLRRSQGGFGRTVESNVWRSMMSRCYKRNNRSYPDYGGRGIKVCERWHDLLLFLKDMGKRPSNKHSLERKDNDKDYEPGNVIWATRLVQNNNSRKNLFVEFHGKKQTLSQWCRELKLPYGTIQYRLSHGWSVQEAFTTPVVNKSIEREVTFRGVTGNLKTLAKEFGVNSITLSGRLIKGWTLEEALTIKDGRKERSPGGGRCSRLNTN